jgi:predicted oxidoreductase
VSSDPDYSLCPACPEIKKKIDRIDLALMGPDGTGMKDGIVHAITQLQKNGKVQDSWVNNAKPILFAVVSSVLTFALTYALTHPW